MLRWGPLDVFFFFFEHTYHCLTCLFPKLYSMQVSHLDIGHYSIAYVVFYFSPTCQVRVDFIRVTCSFSPLLLLLIPSQHRAPDFSGYCWTSTASSTSLWALCDSARSGRWWSGRGLGATSRAQEVWSGLGPKHMPERLPDRMPDKKPEWMLEKMPDRMADRMCQNKCQKEWEIGCQSICQKESQKICQIGCQKTCHKICQKACQNICMSDRTPGQKDCQKICQRMPEKTVRRNAR